MKKAPGRQAWHSFGWEEVLTAVGCSRGEHGHRSIGWGWCRRHWHTDGSQGAIGRNLRDAGECAAGAWQACKRSRMLSGPLCVLDAPHA